MIVNHDTIVPDHLFCPEGKRRVEYVDTGGTGLENVMRVDAEKNIIAL